MAILFFIAGLFAGNITIDIHMHDTYLIVGLYQIIWTISLILMLIWLAYIITNKWLYSKALTWVHISCTLLASVVILIWLHFISIEGLAGIPRRYVEIQDSKTEALIPFFKRGATVLFYLLAAGQLIYPVNLIWGLSRRNRLL